MKRSFLSTVSILSLLVLSLATAGWAREDESPSLQSSRFLQDPGQPDTVYTTIDAPLVIPQGGGDVVVRLRAKTDNSGAGNDIVAIVVPLIVTSSDPAAQIYLADTTVAFIFNGTAVAAWPIRQVTVDSNNFVVGAVIFSGSGLLSGTHLLANLKLHVTGPTTLIIDTLFFPPAANLGFTTSLAVDYQPKWKSGSYPVACPTCPANQAPVLNPIGSKSVNEGQTLSFRISATDPDATIPILSVANKPNNAVFVDSGNGAGSFVFTPTFTQSAIYNVTFKASDGQLSDSEIVQITVNNVNRPPVLAAIGAKSVDEGQVLSFKVSATDPDGDTAALTAVGVPTNGNLVDSLNGSGGFFFNPDFTQSDVYNVVFIASDGVLADSEVVQITVNNVNRAPVLAAIGAKSVDEGQNLSFKVTATDPDGDTAALTAAGVPTNGNLVDSLNGSGGFFFNPDFTQSDVYNVVFIASDGVLTDSEVVQITVNNVNRAPVLTAIGAKSVDEGQTLSFKVSAIDPDGNTPNLAALNKPTNSDFADSGNGRGGFVFSPDFTQADVYNVTFIASDGILADTEIVQITVNNVNRAPAIDPIGSKSVQEENTLAFRVSASDPDADVPSLTVPNPPANAVFVDSGNGAGGFVFNPDSTQAAVYPVTFIASDGSLADTEVVTITVTEQANQPPVLAAIGSKSVDEGQSLSFKVTATDPDGTDPVLAVPNPPLNASFVDSGNGIGGFFFNPDFTQSKLYNVTFIASDGSLADSEVVAITVNNVNRPPVLDSIGPKTVQEGDTLKFRVFASDPDGNVPNLTVLDIPPNADFVDSTNGAGGFIFMPDETQAGVHDVKFVASDGSLADTEVVSITVTEQANQPPVLAAIGSKSVDEGQSLSFKVTATDPDGTDPVLAVPNPPLNASFVDSGNGIGGFVFNPDYTQAAVYNVVFIASDGVLADSEVVQITVNDVNRAPVLDPIGPKSVAVSSSLNFRVHATDPDLDLIFLTAPNVPNNASFVDSGNGSGSFNFSPTTGQAGVYLVKFKASDGTLADSEIVQITVTEGGDQLPFLTISLDQNYCWPPNHKMVSVTATVLATDDRDPSPTVVLWSVTNSEPDDAKGVGDGSTVNDIQDASIGTLDLNLALRCERDGRGSGRTYTICYRATDNAGNSTTTCATFLVAHDMGGSTSSSSAQGTSVALVGNHPNPFNATTSISFSLPEPGSVTLSLYNITGHLVKEFSFPAAAGDHSVIWDGTDNQGNQIASGVYFYRLKAGDITETRKMLLLR